MMRRKRSIACLGLFLCLTANIYAQSLDVQALSQAKSFFSRMYKRCGEHYYYKYRERRWHLYQCRYAPTVTAEGKTLSPKVLSEADRLNGVDPLPIAWEGSTRIHLGLCRQQTYFYPVELGTDSWSAWADVNNHGLSFKNVKGDWQFYNEPTGREMYTKEVIVPVACEDVPDPNRVAPASLPKWEKKRSENILAMPANYPEWFYVGTGPMRIKKFCQPCTDVWIDGTGNARSAEGAGSNSQALAPNALLGSVIAKIGKTGSPFQLFPPRSMSNYDGYNITASDEIYLAINDSVFTDNRGVHGVILEGKNLCIDCPIGPNAGKAKTEFKWSSGGVLNGKAIHLPKPSYPAAAIAVKAEGVVEVEVLVSQEGNVTQAAFMSGHPLLRGAAEGAARAAKFPRNMAASPNTGIFGTLTFNFVLPR